MILTPLADWAGKVWKFWTLPGSPPPGTLEQALQEGVLMTEVSHQLMRQQLTNFTAQRDRKLLLTLTRNISTFLTQA